MQDKRIGNYRYFDMLKNHLKNDLWIIKSNHSTYPRQLEIHLPGNGKKHCNFNCFHCQGRTLDRPVRSYENEAIWLIDYLNGKIPYIIFGGAYSEPLLNKHLPIFLKMTKDTNCSFGIHTNGSLIKSLDKTIGFCSLLTEIANGDDYITISLDAGNENSHQAVKGTSYKYFNTIVDGIKLLVKARNAGRHPAIRLTYLLTIENSSTDEVSTAIQIARDVGVDSLRFSIPYMVYGSCVSSVKEYREKVEKTFGDDVEGRIQPLMSTNILERPYVFYLHPDMQDINKMDFNRCIYPYYQITVGADGNIYRCSSTASPSFPGNILGSIFGLKEGDFECLIAKNQLDRWNVQRCLNRGGRCNRMALECNLGWKEQYESKL